jgi:two-component system chemotaxis response regulator CheB
MSERQPVRVLVVDDSALTRKVLVDLLRTSPEVEVVGTAKDGSEAIELAGRLKPDVVTLDVEMPGLSGLETLPALLAVHPVPVVMVSALTQEGAEVTLAALELGAVDFLPKPGRLQLAELRGCRDLLVSKVLSAAQSRVRKPRGAAAKAAQPRTPPARVAREGALSKMPCVVLGISTGGPQTLSQAFAMLRPPIPPVLVVQHMPAQFTAVFAQRLDRQCAVAVKEAADGDAVLPNRILIAPGGQHMTLAGMAPSARVTLDATNPPVSGHRPSIDVLFESAARVFGPAAVGIIMTGMGRDGVEGCKRILAAGGATFGQDEATSVVYGMNKAAQREGAVQAQFASDELPALIEGFAKTT